VDKSSDSVRDDIALYAIRSHFFTAMGHGAGEFCSQTEHFARLLDL
jgi:hypothetical protein